ncbi:MAG: hypothetical protein WD737_04735 [Gemmatimonadota bacterium]
MSKRRQPQRLPPPIMHGAEAIDSEVVLTEFSGELGLLLWKSVRAVRLWAATPPKDRGRLFEATAHERRAERLADAGLPAEVRAPLERAATVLQRRPRAATVARACRDIGEWASARGELGTAIEFMQAAGMVLPENAELAHEVAKLARTRADYGRAETWYRQAISRARRAADWHEFARSYIGLGKVLVLRGSFPQARRSLTRGLRAAKRFSIRPLAAAAYHELMVLSIQSERSMDATRYAKCAVDAYGAGHQRLPALAFDYGAFLLNSGYPKQALTIFKGVPADFGRSADRLLREAAIVQAAGSAGDHETYASAWAESERLLREPSTARATASALLAMAHGADAVSDFVRAERTASEALKLSADRGESLLELAALSLMDAITSHAAAAEQMAAEPPVPSESVIEFVGELEQALGRQSRYDHPAAQSITVG